MELNILEDTPKRLVFELKGATHTLCNPIKVELWNNKHVKVSTYSISHPLVGVPKFIVETDGTVKPKKALSEAAARLADSASKLRKEFKKVKS